MNRRYLSFFILILALCCCFTAYAENVNDMTRASEIIDSCSLTLYSSGTNLTASGLISANYTCTKIGAQIIKIQEYRNGSWVTVASKSSAYGYNVSSHRASVTYTGRSGYKYRATCTFYASDGSISDTQTRTTGSKTI